MPRHFWSATSKTSSMRSPGEFVARIAHRAHILILKSGIARLQLLHQHEDGLQNIDRFESADHDRHAEVADQRFVFAAAHDGADVAGRDEALHAVLRRRQQGANGRRHQDVRHQHREVAQPLPLRLPGRHRIGGSGGFKSDREEDDLAIGMTAGDLDRFRRRVGDANIGALRLCAKQIGIRSGNAQHVAVGNQDDFRHRASAMALSMVSSGVTQTGQPGPCTSSNPLGSSSSRP